MPDLKLTTIAPQDNQRAWSQMPIKASTISTGVLQGLYFRESKMGEVLEMLESNATNLQLPPKAFYTLFFFMTAHCIVLLSTYWDFTKFLA